MFLTNVLSCHGLCKAAPVVLTVGSVTACLVSEPGLSWKQILRLMGKWLVCKCEQGHRLQTEGDRGQEEPIQSCVQVERSQTHSCYLGQSVAPSVGFEKSIENISEVAHV